VPKRRGGAGLPTVMETTPHGRGELPRCEGLKGRTSSPVRKKIGPFLPTTERKITVRRRNGRRTEEYENVVKSPKEKKDMLYGGGGEEFANTRYVKE